MSKKDFITLAGPSWDPNKMVQWELDVGAIARVCRADNPRFNYERWTDYINGLCGPNGGKH